MPINTGEAASLTGAQHNRRQLRMGAAVVAGAAAAPSLLAAAASVAGPSAVAPTAARSQFGVATGVRYFDGSRRRYLRAEVTSQAWRTDVRVVDTVAVRDAPTYTGASHVGPVGKSQPAARLIVTGTYIWRRDRTARRR